MSDSCNTMACCPPALCPWDFPGKNTGVVYHSLLQGIFLTQGLNLGLLHCRQILYQLSLTCQEGSISVCALSHFSHIQLFMKYACSPPGSSAHGILQARLLEWVPCPPPGDLLHPGLKPTSFYTPCSGRRVLYHSMTWEAWLVAKSIPEAKLSAKSQLWKNAISGSFFCDVVSVIDIIYIFIHIFYKFQNDISITPHV